MACLVQIVHLDAGTEFGCRQRGGGRNLPTLTLYIEGQERDRPVFLSEGVWCPRLERHLE